MLKREVCGADARGAFDRSDFGLVVGKDYGFDTEVRLQIQVDAIQAQ
jgi:polyisoprenoid-binding protein YceI